MCHRSRSGLDFTKNLAGRVGSGVMLSQAFFRSFLWFASGDEFGGGADILRLVVDVDAFVRLLSATVTVMYKQFEHT